MTNRVRHILSISGGKDSAALAIEPFLEPIQVCHLPVVQRVYSNVTRHFFLTPTLVSLVGNIQVYLPQSWSIGAVALTVYR